MKKRTCVPCYSKLNQRMDAQAVSLMKQGNVKESNMMALASLTYWGKRAEASGFSRLAKRINNKVYHLMNGASQ